MSVQYDDGDPLQTTLQTLAFGYNARGRSEPGPFEARLLDAFPTAFAAYARACRQGRIRAGGLWLWRDSQPQLAFLVVRETAAGITRARYVETAALTLARDYPLYGIESLALTALTGSSEWPLLRPIIHRWLDLSALPVVIYAPA